MADAAWTDNSDAQRTSVATGQRPASAYPEDPSPDYAGIDFDVWSKAEIIAYWELATPLQRSAEYHAMMRRGDWKRFRDIVFHHDDTAGNQRRQRGGRNQAFYDNVNHGWLTRVEIAAYHRARREQNDWEEL